GDRARLANARCPEARPNPWNAGVCACRRARCRSTGRRQAGPRARLNLAGHPRNRAGGGHAEAHRRRDDPGLPRPHPAPERLVVELRREQPRLGEPGPAVVAEAAGGAPAELRGCPAARRAVLMDWYPWYSDLYEADTLHLTPAQDGIYRRLIDWYMSKRRP